MREVIPRRNPNIINHNTIPNTDPKHNPKPNHNPPNILFKRNYVTTDRQSDHYVFVLINYPQRRVLLYYHKTYQLFTILLLHRISGDTLQLNYTFECGVRRRFRWDRFAFSDGHNSSGISILCWAFMRVLSSVCLPMSIAPARQNKRYVH